MYVFLFKRKATLNIPDHSLGDQLAPVMFLANLGNVAALFITFLCSYAHNRRSTFL
jgi:hypothetical protein